MCEAAQAQAITWVMQEERSGDLQALDQAWNLHGLDKLPPALGYLLLECGTCSGYRAALGWYHRALSDVDSSLAALVDPIVLTPRETLEVARGILRSRRRRERVSPLWRSQYQRLTNRTNRVQGRVLRLVREQVREYVFS